MGVCFIGWLQLSDLKIKYKHSSKQSLDSGDLLIFCCFLIHFSLFACYFLTNEKMLHVENSDDLLFLCETYRLKMLLRGWILC